MSQQVKPIGIIVLRKLAAIEGKRVYSCGGGWVSTCWLEGMRLWSEAQMSPYIRTERAALESILDLA